MGTYFSEVYDIFMMTVTDYRLIDLFNSSQEDFENYLQAWLRFSVIEFSSICDQSLLFDIPTVQFNETLSDENIVVLSKLMMKNWLQKVVNDITQMNLHITDRDFKMASEAQNLREKASYYNIIKEECSQLLQDYSYRKLDWNGWYTQEVGGFYGL